MKQPYVEFLGLLLCAIPGTAFAQNAPAPSNSDTVQALNAMDKTYTEGHPDVINEFAGMHRYAAGDYSGAMKSFLIAASYADKPSQLSIGLMYLNGQGVQKDPATAWAWYPWRQNVVIRNSFPHGTIFGNGSMPSSANKPK